MGADTRLTPSPLRLKPASPVPLFPPVSPPPLSLSRTKKEEGFSPQAPPSRSTIGGHWRPWSPSPIIPRY
ncbi:hypothetical protein U9M48_002941 [Paspalum notatum var. saurae]|uniref:Uncharacterized protein n=1 Tax=Paspalum notatum var. saurae TaxID=547442 RepID=A0AAQ3PKN8_PASNO